MQGLRQHPFRVLGRLLWFGFAMLQALCGYELRCAFCPRTARRQARALWLQRTARHVARIFRLQVQAQGTIPAAGLLICNHVSYVDIIALLSLMPAMFVAKREVKSWPVMGLMARLGGTLFIDRQRRTQVGEINHEIQTALDDGALVIVFPEGTSSDGQSVLPFKSSLLEPATQLKHPLTVGCIQYTLANGDADETTPYWGESLFFSHLLNLLSQDRVRATIRFAPVPDHATDRKKLALQLHAAVLELGAPSASGSALA